MASDLGPPLSANSGMFGTCCGSQIAPFLTECLCSVHHHR